MIACVEIGRKTYKIEIMGFLRSMIGLMFDSLDDKDGALIHGNSIWMLFVKKELWLLFLDNDMRILKVEKAVPMTLNPKTWKTYSCWNAVKCLELKTNPGDVVGKRVRIGSLPCSRL